MKITFFGTRGSIPVSGPDNNYFGGNTTCLGIESECLPKGFGLAIDAGSGFIPCSRQAIKTIKDLKEFHVLFTHWHHDHTQGLTRSPLVFMKDVKITSWGPVENGYGPREVLEYIMKPPFFPVDFSRVGSHFEFEKIENPDSKVIAIHPTGGFVMLTIEELERGNGFVSFAQKGTYPVNTCLIIKMRWTNHTERTISYRLEEGPTGAVFVFLTDHENQSEMSKDMLNHIKNADLLAMDCQYTTEQYKDFSAGWGHGTPDYCVSVAKKSGAKLLGLTHHDPDSTDQDIALIVRGAVRSLRKSLDKEKEEKEFTIFACRDFCSFDTRGRMLRVEFPNLIVP